MQVIYCMYGLGLWYGVKLMLDDRETEEFPQCQADCVGRAANSTDREHATTLMAEMAGSVVPQL